MTQSVRLKWVFFVATLNAVFALAVGGLVAWGLRSARTPPPPAPQQLSCPAPDAQLSQTLQLLAAGQQAMMLRALQPPPAAAPPAATPPPILAPQPIAARQRSARRSARRSRRLRPVCRAK